MKKNIFISIVLLFILSLPACGIYREGSGIIIVAGSTTVTPVMRELAHAFERDNDITIAVQELGTTGGINATISGVSHLAMSSRPLSAAEAAQGLVPSAFAMDGIAVVVHLNNPVTNLTLEQITGIFQGKITNWSEVGGENGEITVVSREEGSGIRTGFETFANLQEERVINYNNVRISLTRPSIISQGTGAVIASVSGNENAIGYITTGIETDALRDISINGVFFSEETVKNGTYIFANVFYIAHMETASEEVMEFVNFIMSPEGQRVVSQSGYVSISD